ncbi:MAG: hypothetical protein AB7N65_05070 [Vicinamibacterales bacterium]
MRRPSREQCLVALLVVAAVLIAGATTADAQCAMCRTVLGSPEGQRMIGALRSGILLLLAAPFAVFGTVAVLAVRAQRRRRSAAGSPGART